MQDYVKLSVIGSNDETMRDFLATELAEAGAEAFDEDGDAFNAYVPCALFDAERFDAVFDSEPFRGIFSRSVERLPARNWNSVWESNFEPVIVAGRCVVYASFHKDVPKTEHSMEHSILIDPRMTFGTGHHETTRLCIEAILDETIEGKTTLDMGCGTGVLGILAAKRGASSVTAIDNDPAAAENAAENAALNGVDSRFAALTGDASTIAGRKFDLVLANINRNVLLNDTEKYAETLREGGALIMSGFYAEDVPLLMEAAEASGLVKTGESALKGWTALKFEKR
ncbi:MAG: 50S ribosomal protein L11 methyltransferase [Prevotellaceae bacterium]|jgi:ribosomal protein L11 methyltransferase|nr:50S ribosomal protein L11 methyltransferase [Prevotellaceae bacterium]